MDRLTFILGVTKALAWPIVAVLALFVLKKPIEGLLSLLVKIRYKDLEISFAKGLTKAESNVEPAKVDEKQIEHKFLYQLPPLNPRAAILASWRNIEVATMKAAQRLKLSKREYSSPIQVIRILDHRNILDSTQVELFSDLRDLRNQAEYSPEMALSTESALRYIDLAESFVRSMNVIDNH